MSSLAAVSQAPVSPEVRVLAPLGITRLGHRRKCLAALLVAALLGPALLAFPPVWHGALRLLLTWQASRDGYELTVARIGGGIAGVTRLEGVRLRRQGVGPAASDTGTDLTVDLAQFAVAWQLPWTHRPVASLRELRLEGVRGCLDLTPPSRQGSLPVSGLNGSAARWLPASFAFQADDLLIRQGEYRVRLTEILLTGKSDVTGEVAAREVRAEGPGFATVSDGWHGQTLWKGGRLIVTGLDLGNGVALANATLDASQLGRCRLGWDCSLQAFGGDVRGQGGVDFARTPSVVEFAATLRHTSLAAVARALGSVGPVDGQVEQASVTFRGDPENIADAQMWIAARATGLRCGERGCETLDTQAVVVNRRVQLHRFDLCQHGNRVSLAGEFPLPPNGVAGLEWTGEGSWWQAAGFSCQIDARLEDLTALAGLAGPGVPDLAGRMSINGQLSAAPGRADINGYLNVEGTRLTIRGAPLDFLRSTLLFRGGAMEVADVQATHDADYFTAHGVVGLSGEHADRRGEVQAEVKDMCVYTPALAGLPGIGERAGAVRHLDAVLRWENGEVFFDRWEGEQADQLLVRASGDGK